MIKTYAIACLACLGLGGSVLAVSPVTVSHNSQADFAEAQAKNVVVWSLGEITLGRSTGTIMEARPDVDAVSALAVDADGAVIVGTATRALVLRIGPEGQIETLADLPGVMVTDLLVDGSAVYAATAGESAGVYRIQPGQPNAPATKLWSHEQAQSVWAIARSGSMLLAATAPNGMVFAIERSGEAQAIFTAKQGALRSIATDGQAVLVGTGEEGLVYRLEPAGDKWTSRVLLDAQETEIVALGVDADGAVFAAATDAAPAGAPGPADADGGRPAAPTTRRAQGNTHARAITPGNYVLRAGDTLRTIAQRAYGDGRQFTRILQANPGFAPQRARPGQKLTIPPPASAPSAGASAGAPASRPKATPCEAPASAPARELPNAAPTTDPATPPTAQTAPATRPGATSAPRTRASRARTRAAQRAAGDSQTNAVYRIGPDGFVKVVLRQGRPIADMVVAPGKVFLGVSGDEGAVLELRLDAAAWGAVASFEPRQVTALALSSDGSLLAGTTDAATVVRIDQRLAETGTLVSCPLDAEQIARWSAVDVQADWPGGSTVTVAARTGNVAEPDQAAWSTWSRELPVAQPWAPLESPAGRFAQYRLTLTRGRAGGQDASPVVDAVHVASQVGNLPPEIESVTAEPADRSKAGQAAAKDNGPRRYRVIRIKAADANKDELRYTISYRLRGTELWIQADAEVEKATYTWDTQTVPDGVYEIKVQASDAPANAPATALTHEWISRPVVVDNTPPAVTDLNARVEGRLVHLSVSASDASRVTAVQAVVDSGDEPVILDADDGVLDSPAEKAVATLSDLAEGPHLITVKVQDEFGNAVYQAVVVTMPGRE